MPAGPTTMPALEADGTTIRNLLGTQNGSNQFSAGAMLVHPTTGAALIGQATKANGIPVAFASDQVGTAGTPSSDVISVQGISGGTALPTLEQSRAAAAANVHAPAANTAAVVTYSAAGSGVSNVIGGIAWSYNAAPTSGNLKVEDGSGTTVFSIDITVSGPGFIPFARPLKGTANTALIITLAAGGSGVSGKVSVLSKWAE